MEADGRYIVVLKDDGSTRLKSTKAKRDHIHLKATDLLEKHRIGRRLDHTYESAIKGFSIKMTQDQAHEIEKDDLVSYVEKDQQTYALCFWKKKPTQISPNSQTKPWGVSRVGGGQTYNGTNVAWVIDSGIDLTHPDLNVDQSRGVSFVEGISSLNDDCGHGTHVAGIIGAKNNTFGTVGVAAGATVIPVKVLDSAGQGLSSYLLAGINYVAANGKLGDVVNISVGCGVSQAIDDAVISASEIVKFSIAAGNDGKSVSQYSPARVNGANIYIVSAMEEGDTWASYSNFGSDFCAPGSSIFSTFKGGGYITKSGTSMAAPHVAGLLLLGSMGADGVVNNNPIAHIGYGR